MRDKRTFKGFILSFLLHLLVFALFFLSFDKMKFTPPPPQSEKKITLNLSQFTPPVPKQTPPPKPKPKPPVVPPKPKVQPKSKPKPKKPVIKPKPPVPVAKKKHVEKKKGFEVAKVSKEENNATKVVKEEIKKVKPKKKIAKKKKHARKKVAKQKPLPKSFHLPKRQTKDKLANALLGGKRSTRRPARRASAPSSRTSRMINQLYGREFYSFTKTQQKFIQHHLDEIYRITQNTLVINGYPDVAVRTGQQGTNVVSFYLHPNGAITNLHLVRPIGYEALDKNTIAVIQIAYKDYPRPKTKTKIVFYVNYRLY